MEELIVLVIQFVVEIFWQAFIELPFDLLFSDSAGSKHYRAGMYFLALVLGAGIGALSLLLVPHTLLHASAGRMLNVVLSPLCSAYLSFRLSHYRNRDLVRIDATFHSTMAFLFTLGFAIIRFAYAQH